MEKKSKDEKKEQAPAVVAQPVTPAPAKPGAPKFEVVVGTNHTYVWKFLSGDKLIVTSKNFPGKDEAFASIRVVKDSVPGRGAIDRKEDKGKLFFRLKTSSHQFLATSEAFEKPEDFEAAVLMMRKAPQAAVIDRTSR